MAFRPVVLFLMFVTYASAQSTSSSISFRTGYAPASASGVGLFGVNTTGRSLFESTIGYSRRIHQWRRLDLSFYGEIIPLLFITDPAVRETISETSMTATPQTTSTTSARRTLQPISAGSITGTFTAPDGTNFKIDDSFKPFRTTSYGAGARPIGLDAHVLPHRRIQPFIEGTLGFATFLRDEPVDKTSAFNFSCTFGAGVDLRRGETGSYTIGYRMTHFSNAKLAYNPGVNTNFVYVGYRFRRRQR